MNEDDKFELIQKKKKRKKGKKEEAGLMGIPVLLVL